VGQMRHHCKPMDEGLLLQELPWLQGLHVILLTRASRMKQGTIPLT
jgi:hypothetical protein